MCNNRIGTTSLKIQYCKFLPSATVVAERLCFHRCLSPQGGGVHSPPGRHPPCQAYTPPRQTPPPLRWLLQRTVLECVLVCLEMYQYGSYTVVKSARGTLAKMGLTGHIFRSVTKIENPTLENLPLVEFDKPQFI